MTAQELPDESVVDRFRRSVRGRILHPGDDGYAEARSVWNGMIDRYPSMILQASGAADVMQAIDFAREHDVPLSIKAGGHNVAGKAVRDDGLLVDLSEMNGVRIDPESKTARVGPGATWGDFDHEAQAHGLATTGGVDSRTGVAGLTLGGGIGWLVRSFGLACDNLLGADVVTADGELVHASETENADLFWGLRGGGGNFGVVTSFEFELHEVGPEVLVGQAYHPFEDGKPVLQFYREFVADAPKELTCYAFVLDVPPMEPFPEAYHGEPSVALVACYAGDVEAGRAELEPLETFGDPIVSFVDTMPYTALQQQFDESLPDGARYYGKSAYIAEVSDELIDDLLSVTDPLPGPLTSVFFEAMGGTVSEVDTTETAFPHRDAPFNLSAQSGWQDETRDDEMMAWAREFYETIQPYSTGGVYANYLDQDDDDRVGSAFKENYDRLVELKREWDPENLFDNNQNISPDES